MEMAVNCNNVVEEESKGSCNNHCKVENFKDFSGEESGESSSSSVFFTSNITSNGEISSSYDSSSTHCLNSEEMGKSKTNSDKIKLQKLGSSLSESEMMRERFSKLLLGEDMSGYGNGVCSALALSNAITNLCATIFGQIWRLQPLKPEKKLTWRKEIDWLLCVSDHIVELIPSWQTFPDGTKLEVMTSRPRSDLYINLPALRKLDNMLLEILDAFEDSEFWYVDQGIIASSEADALSKTKTLPSQEDKWWLPVPRLPPGGLSEESRKTLQHRRDCANQILKAAMAINSSVLADMDIPDSYLEALPKNAKTSLGDFIHRYINSDQFGPECLLDCLDLTSDHHALEIANRVEASIYIWRRKTNLRHTKWEMVKDFVSDGDKTEQLADRAENLLLCLKQRFPGLPHTTLDTCKIQYNKDIGKSILESYSRVVESVAFNIVARIDDLFYVDDLSKHSDQFVSISKIGMIGSKNIGIACSSSPTPYYTNPGCSPLKVISPANVDMSSPYIESSKRSLHRFGWKRLLLDTTSDSSEMSLESCDGLKEGRKNELVED